MKTLEFDISGGIELLRLEETVDLIDRWGVTTFQWTLENGDPVEGVVVEWDVHGDDVHLIVLMSDDHAARFAVAPESGNVDWS